MKEKNEIDVALQGKSPIPTCSLNHPDDVLSDASMEQVREEGDSGLLSIGRTRRQRRTRTTSARQWRCRPSRRHPERALRALDGAIEDRRSRDRSLPFYARLYPRRREALRNRLRDKFGRRGPGDDDTPPTAPAAVLVAA